MMTKALFLDLETTGLDPERDLILEVGAIMYDLAADRECGRQNHFPDLGPEWKVKHGPMDPYVYRMHVTSGLWDVRAKSETVPMDTIEFALIGMLNTHGFSRGECMVGGFSPGFDRGFLRVHMPTLAGFLSHRDINASVLRELSKAYGKTWPKGVAHRALSDCREAIATVRLFRSAIESVAPPKEK